MLFYKNHGLSNLPHSLSLVCVLAGAMPLTLAAAAAPVYSPQQIEGEQTGEPGATGLTSDAPTVSPMSAAPLFSQVARFNATGAASHYFGAAVAIGGDTIVAGAPNNGGVAYWFRRDSGGVWKQVARRFPSDLNSQRVTSEFGAAVAISGDTAVIGNPEHDGVGRASGAVYVFGRHQGGSNRWGEVKPLAGSANSKGDNFGYAVGISGDHMVVGAPRDDIAGTDAGAAYIFARNLGGVDYWGEVVKLSAADAARSDRFGDAVAIAGDTVAVGAKYADTTGSNAGAVYVFSRNLGGSNYWGQVAKLQAPEAAPSDNFGAAVALHGDTLIVGAPNQSGSFRYAGAAYLYYRDQGGSNRWGLVKKLTAADAASYRDFGLSVAIYGDRVVIGDPALDAAYVFARHQGGANRWGQQSKFYDEKSMHAKFGQAVAISGNRIVVGDPYGDPCRAINAGLVHVYDVIAANKKPPAALLRSPCGDIIDNTPAYSWEAVAGATRYQVSVEFEVEGRKKQISGSFKPTEVGCKSGVNPCVLRATNRLPDGPASWWVKTVNSSGSTTSKSMRFTVR